MYEASAPAIRPITRKIIRLIVVLPSVDRAPQALRYRPD
jgi:hypothetical protein